MPEANGPSALPPSPSSGDDQTIEQVTILLQGGPMHGQTACSLRINGLLAESREFFTYYGTAVVYRPLQRDDPSTTPSFRFVHEIPLPNHPAHN